MKVVVTGAAGFLGRHVCAALERDHEVIPVVRPGGRMPSGALPYDLEEATAGHQLAQVHADAIVHLAAVVKPSAVGLVGDRAAAAIRRIDQNVVEACRRTSAHLIYVSTTAVYGRRADGREMMESDPPEPASLYAAAKLAGEHLASSLGREARTADILRVNAPYGPGSGAATVMNRFVRNALQSQQLMFHGSGSREQAFTYISDIADAVRRAIADGNGSVMNISGGQAINMRDLAEFIVSSLGSISGVIPSGQLDPEEGATARYSIDRAFQVLGWKPETDLWSGVAALAAELGAQTL